MEFWDKWNYFRRNVQILGVDESNVFKNLNTRLKIVHTKILQYPSICILYNVKIEIISP